MASTNRLLSFLFLGAIAAAISACASPAAQECGATGIYCPAGTHCAAAEGVCISDTNTCGNAHVDPGEVCDDGNTKDGDGCSANCLSDESCGNGIRDSAAGEVCDDGNTKDGDGCSANCKSDESCGNKIVDTAVGEACDDGNHVSGDKCSADCKSDERCGNGITDTAAGEICDVVPADPTKCSPDCKSSIACGNAILDPGEECDFGQSVNSPTGECRPDCIFNRCGDGYINTQGSSGHTEHVEQCDAAPQAAKDVRDLHPTESASCNIDCSIAICGDGKVNALNTAAPATALGEQCDDGNRNNDDGCDNNCTFSGCGNGIVDIGEQCDDGNRNNNDSCDNNCKMPGCGNGVLNTGETCDDGNLTDGDGCDRNCKPTGCGNGVMTAGEQCDDSNISGGDGCSATCRNEVCGNGILDPGEKCDDGNNMSGDGCTGGLLAAGGCVVEYCGDGTMNDQTTHTHEDCDTTTTSATCNFDCTNARCGDGIVNPLFKPNGTDIEQCDPPSATNGCSASCRFEHCGNGVTDPGEQCDDANTNKGDGCFNCRLEVCGNGLLDPGEQCDDGNANNGDGCTGGTLAAGGCKIEFCGDGTQNDLTTHTHEDCDTTTTSAMCNFNCTTPTCGDGIVNPLFKPDGTNPEQCDPPSATNGCSATCRFEHCGNGVTDPGEQCDDANVASGDGCFNCHFEKCGNGILDNGEQCDDGNASDTDACVSNSIATASCKIATCGDLHVEAGVEECDLGSNNGKPGFPCSATCHTVTCGNGIIEQGENCDDGPPATNNAAGKSCNATCHRNTCGDGDKLIGIEQCDSNGVDTLACDTDCTLPVCGDGHPNIAAGEACDDGPLNGTLNDTCDAFCQFVGCGNGLVDFGEQCDPGTPATNTSTCDSDCTLPLCGDGLKNTVAGEACDDGANNGEPCAYDDQTCTRCNSTCTGQVSPGGPFCGDAVLNGTAASPEVCDDGARNGGQCAYGTVLSCLSGPFSTICRANCAGRIPNTPRPNGPFCGDAIVQAQFNEQCDPGTGLTPTDTAACDNDCSLAICGDGHVNAAALEGCDDGNANACGSCSTDCVTPSLSATGTITAVAGGQLAVGDTFTLTDGLHAATVFEFRKGGPAGGGNVLIIFANGDSAATVRDSIVAAINGVGATLDINATAAAGATLTLTNTHISSVGNTGAIAETVVDAGFVTTAMVGGTGTECAAGIGCKTGADCLSGTCGANGRCL